MGICCEAHLIVKINEYITLAQHNQVTVGLIDPETIMPTATCDYCKAKPKYWAAYQPK